MLFNFKNKKRNLVFIFFKLLKHLFFLKRYSLRHIFNTCLHSFVGSLLHFTFLILNLIIVFILYQNGFFFNSVQFNVNIFLNKLYYIFGVYKKLVVRINKYLCRSKFVNRSVLVTFFLPNVIKCINFCYSFSYLLGFSYNIVEESYIFSLNWFFSFHLYGFYRSYFFKHNCVNCISDRGLISKSLVFYLYYYLFWLILLLKFACIFEYNYSTAYVIYLYNDFFYFYKEYRYFTIQKYKYLFLLGLLLFDKENIISLI